MNKELPPSRKADQFVARFPDGLRDQLAEVAKANGRSMNAEIVARLQASFDPVHDLPFAVQEAIEHELDERGGTYQDAHVRIAKLAMANGGTLFHAIITPKTTIEQFKTMLEASKTVIPPDASIIFERKSVNPPV